VDAVPPSPGLLGSARAVLAGLVDIGQTRLQLACTELEEERLRLAELLVIGVAALFCVGIGLVLATLLLVVLFWDAHRVLVLAVATALYLGAAAALVAALRHKARAKPPLFAATLAELRRDRDALRGRAAGPP
jgi:uncharacterized membrane protein YqjE